MEINNKLSKNFFSSDKLKFFKNQKEYCIFALLYTGSGHDRADMLGIRRYHYSIKEAANMWYDYWLGELEKGKEHPEQMKAIERLTSIYLTMCPDETPKEEEIDDPDEEFFVIKEMIEDGLIQE